MHAERTFTGFTLRAQVSRAARERGTIEWLNTQGMELPSEHGRYAAAGADLGGVAKDIVHGWLNLVLVAAHASSLRH